MAPPPWSWLGEEPMEVPGPLEKAEPEGLTDSWLWMRCIPFLSAIGERVFFFRIPAHTHFLE